MYAVVRRYRFDPENSEEIDTRIKDVFVHLLRKAPGFEAYYWLDTGEGEGFHSASSATRPDVPHPVFRTQGSVMRPPAW